MGTPMNTASGNATRCRLMQRSHAGTNTGSPYHSDTMGVMMR
jgi:hypothetical protein